MDRLRQEVWIKKMKLKLKLKLKLRYCERVKKVTKKVLLSRRLHCTAQRIELFVKS